MSTETMGAVISAADAHAKAEVAKALAEQLEQHAAELAAANARATQAEQSLTTLRAEYDAHMATHPTTPPPPDPDPEPEPEPPKRQVILGMSAFPELWDQRLREVGADGIKARRIFCNFTSSGRDKESLIRRCIADGMMPILSYKGTPSAANVAAVRTFLNSLGVEVTATWHHEPHGDMTPQAFREGSTAMLAAKSATIKVGPILNGWLLDKRVADWASYTSPELLDQWSFLGLDTYSEGTVANPSTTLLCGRAIPKAVKWLAEQGHPDMPILIGEYNGQTVEGIRYAGEQILNTPQVWVACQWNMDHMQDGGLKFNALSGARLDAFKATKAAPAVAR